jgi:hypothetical protein
MKIIVLIFLVLLPVLVVSGFFIDVFGCRVNPAYLHRLVRKT